MKKDNKLKRSKHGASSIFLAIILSALILVECTFLTFVWNLDYALTVNTSLKTQIDTILSDYNRQLFSVYGLYAFSLDDVDDECFNKALEINGLEAKSTLYVSATQEITTEDLRKAVSVYYLYRGTGIALKGIVDGYSAMIRELDEKGIIDEISQYMQSPASSYVSQIIKGDDTAEEWISKAGDLLNIEELLEEAAGLNTIRSEFSDALHDSDIGLDVDVADWEEILQTMSALESATESVTDANLETTAKFTTSHYCAYNFDCWIAPDGDASINGTEFKNIHDNKQADAEYIITGLGTFPAVMKTEIMISHVLVLANVLKDYANETIRNTIYAIACVISEIISAVSEGAVNIDPRIIAAGLTIYCAIVQAIKDLWSVVQGQRAVIFEYEGVNLVTFNYRDFLYLFSLCTPEDELLERSLEVLNRDYGTLYKGITLEADFRGNTYSLEKSYQLYE